MNRKNFFAAMTAIMLIIFNVNAYAVGRMPASELLKLDEAPKGEIVRPLPMTLTSENSGVSEGHSVTPVQNTRPVDPDDKLPNVTATAAIVIEASTGHVIYERNADKIMFPASTTKMMTLITALESNKLDEIVTVGPNAYHADGATLWLNVGEQIPLGELLYGMMLVSGNDGTIAIAEHCGGTVENFAARMTQRAHELGATNTNFTNPAGFPDDIHYTTARDLAIIARHGFTLDHFEEIVSTKDISFPWIHVSPQYLNNENQMLWLYRGANGIKTGYTIDAGRCLVTSAKQNGIQLIAVMLDSLYVWNDAVFLLDYGFGDVTSQKLIEKGQFIKSMPITSGRRKSMPIKADGDIIMPVFSGDADNGYSLVYDLPESLPAPITAGETIGKIRVVLANGTEAASVDVITTMDVEQKSFFRLLLNKVREIFA
ncbi:MAG: D-alanyl-D-alanine carboxypeptidase [Selenomonadaceae bacterium]|nr:D-alanyl-D-alanine carboxypeptidase [Selenomonadaceae bacterium]